MSAPFPKRGAKLPNLWSDSLTGHTWFVNFCVTNNITMTPDACLAELRTLVPLYVHQFDPNHSTHASAQKLLNILCQTHNKAINIDDFATYHDIIVPPDGLLQRMDRFIFLCYDSTLSEDDKREKMEEALKWLDHLIEQAGKKDNPLHPVQLFSQGLDQMKSLKKLLESDSKHVVGAMSLP